MPTDPARVEFHDQDGKHIAWMSLYPESDALAGLSTIVIATPDEAAEFGEARIQLLETASYEYEVEVSGYRLRDIPGIVRPSYRREKLDGGRITPGASVGRIRLTLLFAEGIQEAGYADIEVRAAKIGYRDEYREMLAYITQQCADLLLEFRSPAEQSLLPDDSRDPETLCQQFAFVKSLLFSCEFRDAVQRVIGLPHRLWEQEEIELPLSRGAKPTAAITRQIATASRRIPLSPGHPLSRHIRSIPERVRLSHHVESLDTPENRFVKHVLRTFLAFTAEVRERLEDAGRELDFRFIEEAIGLEEQLEETLNRDFFREISAPEMLPLGSPVLQRKGGYREILTAWLQFDMAARLCWHGGADVYGAGKRDAATLYEYWAFFRLLDIVSAIFRFNKPAVQELIEKTGDGFGLKLKSGKYLAMRGYFESGGRKLSVEFSYNRTFSAGESHFKQGSWTKNMRPDYTLSLWPAEFTPEEAEAQELMVHVHFDAKYRVDRITELFGGDDAGEEEKQERLGTYKRADLLKMHAYRDAIRRTHGAYILYPGDDIPAKFTGFREILPGLGAFVLKPGCGDADLARFIRDVVAHVCDRATARERQTYHTYRVQEQTAVYQVNQPIPECEPNSKERHAPPAETFVLVGWCRGEEHRRWIIREGLYNCRMDTSAGSLRLKPEIIGARYLLLHTDGAKAVPGLLRISSEGPRVISKDALKKKGYPGEPRHDSYLIFDVEPASEFEVFKWDFDKIESRNKGRQSAEPYAITLDELLVARQLESI